MRELINQYDNVIIVHSFTKFYAVPGLRIGAVFANPLAWIGAAVPVAVAYFWTEKTLRTD